MFSLQIIISRLFLKISLELDVSHVIPSLFLLPSFQESRRWFQGALSPKPQTINNQPNKNVTQYFSSLIHFWLSDQIKHYFLVQKHLKTYWYKTIVSTQKRIAPTMELARPKAEWWEGKVSCGAVSRHFTADSMPTFGGYTCPTVAAPHVVRSSHFH